MTNAVLRKQINEIYTGYRVSDKFIGQKFSQRELGRMKKADLQSHLNKLTVQIQAIQNKGQARISDRKSGIYQRQIKENKLIKDLFNNKTNDEKLIKVLDKVINESKKSNNFITYADIVRNGKY